MATRSLTFFAGIALFTAVCGGANGASAERPVRWVVPSTPGGATDKVSRILAPRLAEHLRQTIVVENRPGASGNVGAEYVARAAPDGHTLLTCIGSHASNAALMTNVPFDLARDFAPISLIAIAPSVLIGHPSLPAKTLPQLVALAKANPGKLNYASGGVGSIQHMSMELLLTMTGARMVHVPYKATYPALMDTIAGHVPLMVIASASALPQIAAGRVRAFGVTSAKRLGSAPDIPTIAEQGMPGYDVVQWFGLLVPAGTPPDIVTRLHAGILKALQEPETRRPLVDDGMEVSPSASPADFAALIRSDLDKWVKVVKRAGLKLE
jgi:tripartite-type tricarboxylate transporter receptor subunit TctC